MHALRATQTTATSKIGIPNALVSKKDLLPGNC